MIKIEKGEEPRQWTERRLSPGVGYEAIPELREALLREQGYICAYCMRRIPVKDATGNEDSRIEHIKSRNKHRESELDYGNMVICCPGAITGDFHCDKSKGEKEVTFDLFSEDFISTLSYSLKNGEISSDNKGWNKEINEVLNLNHAMLKQNRLQVIEALWTQLNRKRENWTKKALKQQLKEWENMYRDADGKSKYRPYCGVVVYYLRKKLRS